VKTGIFLVGPGNPDAGAVYCLDGGEIADTPETFTFTSISRLGTCQDKSITGTLEVTSTL
jgi:hypothetical protein